MRHTAASCERKGTAVRPLKRLLRDATYSFELRAQGNGCSAAEMFTIQEDYKGLSAAEVFNPIHVYD